MSYSFAGSNDTMSGTFSSGPNSGGYGDPITIACFIKTADHLLVTDALVSLGNSASSVNDSYQIRINSTDNGYVAISTDAAAATSTAQAIVSIDGVWSGIVGRFQATDTGRNIFVQALANTDESTQNRTVADLCKFIRVGETLVGGNDFTGLMAEIAIWKSELSDADITSYLAGTAASVIDPTNLIGYWPLSAANATQANLGVDAGGALTLSGPAIAFNADHPVIVGGGSASPAGRMLMTGIG